MSERARTSTTKAALLVFEIRHFNLAAVFRKQPKANFHCANFTTNVRLESRMLARVC